MSGTKGKGFHRKTPDQMYADDVARVQALKGLGRFTSRQAADRWGTTTHNARVWLELAEASRLVGKSGGVWHKKKQK